METAPKKDKAEIESAIQAAKGRNIQRDTENIQLRKDISEAEDALTSLGVKIKKLAEEKKPGFLRRNWLKIGLATGLAVGTGIGVKEYGSHGKKEAPVGGIAKRETITKERETNKIFVVPPETNMTALANAERGKNMTAQELAEAEELAREEIQESETNAPTPKPESVSVPKPVTPTVKEIEERIRAGFDKELGKTQAEIQSVKAKLAKIEAEKSASVAQPKPASAPETNEQKFARLKKELEQGGKLTNEEAIFWNNEIMKPTPREAVGGGYVYNANPSGMNPNNLGIGTQVEKKVAHNSFGLNEKTSEEVEKVFENKIDEIFPKDTLKAWKNIKDKSAYELMSKEESKVRKPDRALYIYLHRIKNVTGLESRSGVRGEKETVEEYMERGLRYAASKKSLLDELK